MSIRLGALRPSHRTRLAELLTATSAFSSEEVDVALELFDLGVGGEGGADDANVADYELTGAFVDEQLVGYICVGPTPATDGTFDLYWLAVDPAAQGAGVGRALVTAMEDQLRARGGRLVLVETSSRPGYDRTRTFYARLGYSEAARIPDFYAPADDRILLTTRLTTRELGAATR